MARCQYCQSKEKVEFVPIMDAPFCLACIKGRRCETCNVSIIDLADTTNECGRCEKKRVDAEDFYAERMNPYLDAKGR